MQPVNRGDDKSQKVVRCSKKKDGGSAKKTGDLLLLLKCVPNAADVVVTE